MTFFATCDRAGVIRIVHTVPAGVLVIADDPNEAFLSDTVSGLCRLAYDNRTMLVPGIPEAGSDIEALDALICFRTRVQRALSREVAA